MCDGKRKQRSHCDGKYDISMKENGMVEDNKNVCEMKEDTKFAWEKERDSVCVMKQRKNDLTMMGNKKESRCVTENRNNEFTVMEKDNIAMEEKGKVKHNQDTIMENVMDNDKSKSSDSLPHILYLMHHYGQSDRYPTEFYTNNFYISGSKEGK